MQKIISFDIHLSVDESGVPVNGFINYKLDGSTTLFSTDIMDLQHLSIMAAVIEGGNTYYDQTTHQFVKKSQ